MKRSILIFAVVILIIASLILWYLSMGTRVDSVDYVQFIVIAILVLFAVYFGVNRLKSERRGEPAEDEMSLRLVHRTAALSYYVSLYLWVVIIYLKDRVEMDTEQLLGSGVLGMGVIFGIVYFILRFRGLRNG